MWLVAIAAAIGLTLLVAIGLDLYRVVRRIQGRDGVEHERRATATIDDLWTLAQRTAEHRDYLYQAFEELRRGHNGR